MKKLDGFEKREIVGDKYWEDKRWKKVEKLRKSGKNLKANGLVIEIRRSWGVN